MINNKDDLKRYLKCESDKDPNKHSMGIIFPIGEQD